MTGTDLRLVTSLYACALLEVTEASLCILWVAGFVDIGVSTAAC